MGCRGFEDLMMRLRLISVWLRLIVPFLIQVAAAGSGKMATLMASPNTRSRVVGVQR